MIRKDPCSDTLEPRKRRYYLSILNGFMWPFVAKDNKDKKKSDGILVDLHVPPATAPGVTPGSGELHPADHLTAGPITN